MIEEQAPYIVTHSDCPFCSEEIRSRVIASNGTVFAIEDKYPVTPGHLLIIPYRHTADYFSLTEQERKHAEQLLLTLQNRIREDDDAVTGFNVGVNCGESAGQTVMHAHIHLIPRRDGDLENPQGGVRGVITEKMSY